MFYSILQLGLVYALLSLGIYITYVILNFADLGVDGSITLGGALSAVLIIKNINPYVATCCAIIAGMLAGIITGILHVRFKINEMLAGIITSTGLYSCNLIILNHKPNLSLVSHETIFSLLNKFMPNKLVIVLINLFIIICVKVLLNIIFNSKLGLFMRCIGSNPELVAAMGGNVGLLKIIGLAISNSLVALCGSVIIQQQNYIDISMSIGALVLGLTMVIIGLAINKFIKILEPSVCIILGAICYEIIIGTALMLGLPTVYLKLTTAVLLSLVLILITRGKKK